MKFLINFIDECRTFELTNCFKPGVYRVARKLSSLQPRTKAGQRRSVSESLKFDEQILEAAKSITNAAGVLIKASTAAQKGLRERLPKECHYFS